MTSLRVATFNVAFDRPAPGGLNRQMARGDHPQIRRVAAIIQRIRPDVILLCEFDHDGEGHDRRGLDDFVRHYLGVSQEGENPIAYDHRWLIPTNTGERLPFDLDGDGEIRPPRDCYGFGDFHGQYGMALLSRFPLVPEAIRSFRHFRWRDMPSSLLPAALSEAACDGLRLSSKNHIDVPLQIGGQRLHLLAMHPTPPIINEFNRRRNHDELRLFLDYLDGAPYLVDDVGVRGGVCADPFVLLGDFNADPADGDGGRTMMQRLLAHSRIHPACQEAPRSTGAASLARARGHGLRGEPANWTHIRPLRLDYVLPSRECEVLGSGVFWPAVGEPGYELVVDPVGGEGKGGSSDHRLVWVDLALAVN
ncbi:hypothetical protein ATO46_18640 [Aeromonas schubertii]|uniref:endonuclease/exonuclease/phosphatase family protein n=1 Tax=Aeromonas schubertii TaxID=652 RepID=UPI00067E6551|nr:endonuclease/exonuclease/phosphatase family protein [Aeromonas schubertii]KUE79336.1 hypothetical protein ATO46_18640 [Aeromonas schubertii]